MGRGPVWSDFDETLLETCELVHAFNRGRLHTRKRRPGRAPRARGEQPLIVDDATLHQFRPVGDGTYTHGSVLAFGSAGLVAGSLVGSALGNARRRGRARRDARPRWVREGVGELTITDQRILFSHPDAPLEADYTALSDVDLVEPAAVELKFWDDHGAGEAWVKLCTPWATLIFAVAALTTFPDHPLLEAGTWLPPDFEDHCAWAGHTCPPVR